MRDQQMLPLLDNASAATRNLHNDLPSLEIWKLEPHWMVALRQTNTWYQRTASIQIILYFKLLFNLTF